ncbi:MAG: hypothetical protein ACK5GN_00960 [Pseudomonadota bacterium]
MGSFKGDANSRRIDRALHHVSKPWFPMNPDVLKRVRDGLEKNTYDHKFDLLLEELKSDFALFTFIVKELSQKAVLSEDARSIIGNPIELLRWGGAEAIKDILTEHQKLPSIHSLHWSEPFQVQRLRETAIIASTASALSEKKNLDPELGFSRGVIREIGLNLIAWNYPSVYTKVLNSLTAEQNLDEELAKELGFTPALLGTRLFRPDWAADPALQDTEDTTWASYDELCEIGEAVARAENPETYPSAESDWQQAQGVLKETLGENAIDVIREKTVKNSKNYQKSLPEVFGNISSLDPAQQIQRHKRVSRAIDEKHLKYCPETVKNALKALYSEMSDDSVNKTVVGKLLKDVVPDAGFTGGCVFVVDPTSLSLKPRTLIGKVQMRQIANVALEPGDPAVSALSDGPPIIKNGNAPDNSLFAGIYSALGGRKKIGVFYLELPQKASMPVSEETLGVYNVLKKALSDALLLD